jgi:carbon starvation protein CstA
MNKVDEELLGILKEIFRRKRKDEFLDPDDVIAESILKWLLALSVFSICVRLLLSIFEKDTSLLSQPVVATPIAFFFGLLFIHINNKSENPSVIMFALTWVSMVIGLYFT